jgi:PST family polysaccharide transporter
MMGRLLSPYDFGLTATIFALIGFGPMLIDLGTSEATSQKSHITEREVSSLFWLNVSISVALTLLLVVSSKIIASFYGEPALSGIALVSSITFIAAGVSVQHLALLRRALQFRSLALVDISSNLISSALGISMAFTGWGYWALVAKLVAMSLLTVAGVWISCPWIPGRPERTPEAVESVRFGLGVTGFTITDNAALSADRLALGYFYGIGVVGYYQNAFLFYTNALNLLAGPLHNIAVASLSKLRGDFDKFKSSWSAALSTLSFLSALAFALLAVTGQDIIIMLLGPKWAPAGPVLCLFGFRGIAQTVEKTVGWLHVPTGRPDRWMRWGFISAVCQIAAIFVGLPFGLIGVATGSTIASYLLFVPSVVYAGRPLGIGVKDVLNAVGPQTVAGLIAAISGLAASHFLLFDFSVLSRFVVASSICFAVYLAIAVVLFKVTAPLQLALQVLRDLRIAVLPRSS